MCGLISIPYCECLLRRLRSVLLATERPPNSDNKMECFSYKG